MRRPRGPLSGRLGDLTDLHIPPGPHGTGRDAGREPGIRGRTLALAVFAVLAVRAQTRTTVTATPRCDAIRLMAPASEVTITSPVVIAAPR